MATYEVRVWMPDRPGALGDVAGRIGQVGGDVVGIEILERGGGSAIDELIVELPGEVPVACLTAAVGSVDGVAVEDVRPIAPGSGDPQLMALETVAALMEVTSEPALLDTVIDLVGADLRPDWLAMVDLDEGSAQVVVGAGAVPHAAWLGAFVEGSRSSTSDRSAGAGPGGMVWAPIEGSTLHLVLGRPGRPLRARERRRITALARIIGLRRAELAFRRSFLAHPSQFERVGG